MSGLEVILTLIVATLLMLGGYVGYRYLRFQIDKRWNAPIQVQPVIPAVTVARVPEQGPTRLWWDELEALQAQFRTLQNKVSGEHTDAENKLKLARAAEERARKLERDAGVVDFDAESASDISATSSKIFPEVMTSRSERVKELLARRANR